MPTNCLAGMRGSQTHLPSLSRGITDLKLEHAGNVYITDQRTDTVKKFDSRGESDTKLGSGSIQ